MGLVRRQPESLDLSWTDLDGKQLLWLLQRLPRLKTLRLAGLSQSTVEALGSTATPLLRTLDLVISAEAQYYRSGFRPRRNLLFRGGL